jgi:hypothetical protein
VLILFKGNRAYYAAKINRMRVRRPIQIRARPINVVFWDNTWIVDQDKHRSAEVPISSIHTQIAMACIGYKYTYYRFLNIIEYFITRLLRIAAVVDKYYTYIRSSHIQHSTFRVRRIDRYINICVCVCVCVCVCTWEREYNIILYSR